MTPWKSNFIGESFIVPDHYVLIASAHIDAVFYIGADEAANGAAGSQASDASFHLQFCNI